MDGFDAQTIAEREFGEQPDSVDEISEGLKQETFRLNYPKENYILQLSNKIGRDKNGLERNVKAFQLLKDSEIPIPSLVTPELKHYKNNSEEWKYYICECLDGESLESQMTPELTVKSGKILAKIHNFQNYNEAGWLLPEENGFSVVSFEEGSFKKYVLENWQESIETIEEEGWDELVDRSRDFYDSYADRLPDEINPVFCQDDFSTQNIMVSDGEITGIIDFDMAHSGHNQRDLVKSANCFWMIDPNEHSEIREHLYEGYRKERDLEDDFKVNEPIYRIETLSGLVAGLMRMDHFNDFERNFYRENLIRMLGEAEEELDNL
jgi:aminoglycoside phosphotransferase (APT) family kinase protein